MPSTLLAKIRAEQRMRQLLLSAGLPEPDEVEYGESCVRFLYHERQACVVIDLDEHEDREPDPDRSEDEPRYG